MGGGPDERRFALDVTMRAGITERIEVGIEGEPFVRLRGNVALVQTTQSELNREYQVQEARGNGVYVESSLVGSPGPARFAVDFDFLQALENGAVNL